MEVLRPMSETEDTVSIASDLDQRTGRDTAKSGSLRRRDSSWDKKWQDHVEKSAAVGADMPRSSIFAKSPRLPGKVNRSLWEQKADSEQKHDAVVKRTGGGRWTPPTSTTKQDLTRRHTTDSPVCAPHYGAALTDYSSPRATPTKHSRPPYTTSACSSVSSESTPMTPPPPPPSHDPSRLQNDTSDKPLPSPPPSPPPIPNQENGHENGSHWKDEVRHSGLILHAFFASILATLLFPPFSAVLREITFASSLFYNANATTTVDARRTVVSSKQPSCQRG